MHPARDLIGSMGVGARHKRSLWPREHGAYFQLLVPLVTSLVLVPITPAAGLLAVAACCGFLANEPLLVVLGHRGRRLREQDGSRAARQLALLASLTAVAGTAGLWLAPHALEIAAIVAVPTAITIGLAWRRLERSLAGEILAAITLSGASAAVLVAAGSSAEAALQVWGAWGIGYACTVIAAHRVLARHRKPATWHDTVAALVLAATTMAGVALLARGWLVGASTPLALTSLVVVLRAPSAKYMRTVGFVFAIASVVTGTLAFIELR